MIQLGRFLSRLLGQLLKTVLHLIVNLLKPLAKSFLVPLVLTAAASVTYGAIYDKILRSGKKTLIF